MPENDKMPEIEAEPALEVYKVDSDDLDFVSAGIGPHWEPIGPAR